jgi:hypothetical protein
MKLKSIYMNRLQKFCDYLLCTNREDVLYMIEPSCYDCNEFAKLKTTMLPIEEAISECINVFPEYWLWDEENECVYLKSDPSKEPSNSAKIFFGLNEELFNHLFVPYHQNPVVYGGTMLDILVTSKIVGNNIKELLIKIKLNQYSKNKNYKVFITKNILNTWKKIKYLLLQQAD